jgi:hypothetical protein
MDSRFRGNDVEFGTCSDIPLVEQIEVLVEVLAGLLGGCLPPARLPALVPRLNDGTKGVYDGAMDDAQTRGNKKPRVSAGFS